MNIEKVDKVDGEVKWEDIKPGDVFTWGMQEVAAIKLNDEQLFSLNTNKIVQVTHISRENFKVCEHKLLIEGLR